MGIQLGGKLLVIHYIEGLLKKRKSFQINRMIEHYFHSDKMGDIKENNNDKMLDTTKNFQKLLAHVNRGRVLVRVGEFALNLLD